MTLSRILACATLLIAACGGTRTLPPEPPTPAPTFHATEPTSPIDAELQDEVDALILRLFNEDEDVRVGAAARLGDMGAPARAALPYLRDCARLNTGRAEQSCADAVTRINDAG